MQQGPGYSYSRKALWLVFFGGLIASYFLVWAKHSQHAVNFIDGDPEFYYYYLQATFGDTSKLDYEWLKPGSINTITHHPLGVALLLLPFYLIAYFFSNIFHYGTGGTSLPFQLAISTAALFYLILGLSALVRFMKLQNIPDKIGATVLLLLFFGSTLFQYSIVEPAMSHLYSFCFITIFLYQVAKLVLNRNNRSLILSAISLAIVLLIRPNNIFILFFIPFFFSNPKEFIAFVKELFAKRAFYMSIGILVLAAAFQLLTWHNFESTLYNNRYAAYGFYWLHPHLIEMLFGFEAGFFIYCPLCFLLLFGLLPLFKESRFRFYVASGFIALLFYFFSAYSAYTYFDGLGIRVLVDFYAIFALLGAKLFAAADSEKFIIWSLSIFAVFFVYLNLVYSYQSKSGILLRAGMNFEKWKYVFLKTGSEYRGVLGGSNDYSPYSNVKHEVILSGGPDLKEGFDYTGKDFGVVQSFENLPFNSNRIFLEIDCERIETSSNSSNQALICVALTDPKTKRLKSYFQFSLNETPSRDCCDPKTYHYSANMSADFKGGDYLSAYIWNHKLQSFSVQQFAVRIYDYNYNITNK